MTEQQTPEHELEYTAHESVYIDTPCHIGRGTRIWHFCHVMAGARIGAGCMLGQNVYVDRDAVIGDGCKLQNNVSIYKGVVLQDRVFCGPSVVFTNVINPRAFIERKHEFRPTVVQEGATLGANSTIVCGITIGAYALIGAGSVVTKDIPAHALIYGVPARQMGWVCRCGTSLTVEPESKGLRCPSCESRYRAEAGRLRPLS
jgi:UDP-2-acetamido-3-amino-2,3-dideoxy-glucuronate N-acetyltransferase